MRSLIGSTVDSFSLYASPRTRDSYEVCIYPPVLGMVQDFEVSVARFAAFLLRRRGGVEENAIFESADVFMPALSEADVHELTFPTWKLESRSPQAA